MIILAVSTSAKYPSAALCSDSDSSRRTIIVQTDESGKPHSVTLMPLIDSMLEKAGLQLSDIDLFAVDAGPGSFTGVRIGVTTVNAFAYAEKKPIAAVSSLAALRHAAQGRFGNRILCMLDARNGNGYAAVYEGEECIVPPCACVQKEMLDSLSGTEYCNEITNCFKRVNSHYKSQDYKPYTYKQLLNTPFPKHLIIDAHRHVIIVWIWK